MGARGAASTLLPSSFYLLAPIFIVSYLFLFIDILLLLSREIKPLRYFIWRLQRPLVNAPINNHNGEINDSDNGH